MKSTRKQIVAIGGAMAKSIPQGRLVMSYVLGLAAHSDAPKVLQINTASGDEESTALATYRMLTGMRCRVRELPLFQRTPRDKQLRELILSQDIVFVNGGNTKSMLAVWREYGISELLREAWENGVIMAGSSAGGICWFEQCLTDSRADRYTTLDCLGFLPGSSCPHFDGEQGRKTSYHRKVKSGVLKPGIAIDERVGVHFIDNRIEKVITPVAGAGAYTVFPTENGIVQARLKTTLLSENT